MDGEFVHFSGMLKAELAFNFIMSLAVVVCILLLV